MRHRLLISAATVALLSAALIAMPSFSAAQTPPMGGGYTNVIPIPVPENDPQVKAVSWGIVQARWRGAVSDDHLYERLRRPGNPFPDMAQQKMVIAHYVAQGKAVLILDSLTPRGMPNGVCDRTDAMTVYQRRADDAYSAQKALAAMPEIDAKHIFLQGYSRGERSILAINPETVEEHGGNVFAGVIAFYPYCLDRMAFSAPTIILVGDKDDWAPAALCEAIKDRPNLEVAVLPGRDPRVHHAYGSARRIHGAPHRLRRESDKGR